MHIHLVRLAQKFDGQLEKFFYLRLPYSYQLAHLSALFAGSFKHNCRKVVRYTTRDLQRSYS
jgi:hypothetical protein